MSSQSTDFCLPTTITKLGENPFLLRFSSLTRFEKNSASLHVFAALPEHLAKFSVRLTSINLKPIMFDLHHPPSSSLTDEPTAFSHISHSWTGAFLIAPALYHVSLVVLTSNDLCTCYPALLKFGKLKYYPLNMLHYQLALLIANTHTNPDNSTLNNRRKKLRWNFA